MNSITRQCAMCRVPVDSPERFRVEVLFSPGASHNPFEVVPLKQDHTLPVLPRMPLHAGERLFAVDASLLCHYALPVAHVELYQRCSGQLRACQ